MRKLFFLLLLIPVIAFAQVPQQINYQGIIRGSDDLPLMEQNISLRASILDEYPGGTVFYSEVHHVFANRFGLVNLQIGTGNVESGAFSDINWSLGNYWLQIEIDPTGGNDYLVLGANKMITVPYAFHAETVTFNDDADADPTNELITNMALQDKVLVVFEGENEFSVDLSLFNQKLTKEGSQISLSNGGGSVTDEVEDADSDTLNEIQFLSLAGKTLGISMGNTVDLSTISPWKAFPGGIYYDKGEVWVGNAGNAPAVFLDNHSFNVIGSSKKSGLRENELIFWNADQERANLNLDLLQFWDANGNATAAIGGYPGWLGTYLDGRPVSAMGANVADAGNLGLYNPEGAFNVNLGSVMGSPKSGIIELYYDGNAKVGLEATSTDAGAFFTYGPNKQVNTYCGYLHPSNDSGAFIGYNKGNIRTYMFTTDLDAGKFVTYGAGNETNVQISSRMDNSNSGYLSVHHKGHKLIEIMPNNLQIAGMDDNSGEINIFHVSGARNISLNSDFTGDLGRIQVLGKNKVKVDIHASPSETGIISLKGKSDVDNVYLGTDLVGLDKGIVLVTNNGQTQVELGTEDNKESGLVDVMDRDQKRVRLHTDEKNSGEIILYSPDERVNVKLGTSHYFITNSGWLYLYHNDKESFLGGTDPATGGGILNLLQNGYEKLKLGVKEIGSSLITGMGANNNPIFEISPPTGAQNSGGMGFFGPGGLLNCSVGISGNESTGSFTTYTNGQPITSLAINPGNVGTFNTIDADGYVKSMISSSMFNNGGTFTTFLNEGDPLAELTTNGLNAGVINTYRNNHPVVELSTDANGAGGIWLSNENQLYDMILTSHSTSNGGGYLSLRQEGNERVRMYSGHGQPGYIETFGPLGYYNVIIGRVGNDSNLGGIATFDYDGIMTNISCNVDGTAGHIGTYGENGQANCLFTNTNGLPNNGYVGVYDGGGNVRAGMYVDGGGQGVLFAATKNFRMDHPNDPDKEIWYTSLEGPEAGAYLRGTDQLEDGLCTVSFPDHFLEVANSETMTVLVSPLSAESKGLAVIAKSTTGFTIRELFNGSGNYSFDWEVKCVRKGYENYKPVRDKILPAEGQKIAIPESMQQNKKMESSESYPTPTK